ncbi:hypothetical protein AKJ40_03540 [candidate division MSBL1 archaeon SCGC-AAA259M10]|nr:hypothetical protein AKJ40_03540 [candidate division MSBL1 archaeon SCGC-AAA259M10]
MKVLFCWDIDTENGEGKRRQFYRKLYGYTQKKEEKTYKYQGVLEEVDGERINQSVILVTEEGAGEIRKLLEDFSEIFGTWRSFKVQE